MTDQAREARAKQYWHEHQLSYNGPEPKPWETMAEFAAIEYRLGLSAGREQQWISVEDRLPEMDGTAYIVIRNNLGNGRSGLVRITHWQPLPSPPVCATQPEVK